jgi:hypothetical protein
MPYWIWARIYGVGVQSQAIRVICCFAESLLASDGDTVRLGQDEVSHWEAGERDAHPSFLLLSPRLVQLAHRAHEFVQHIHPRRAKHLMYSCEISCETRMFRGL